MVHYVVDYPDVQSALDAAADGDRVYIPAGEWQAPEGGWKIRKSLEVFGDGQGHPRNSSGTTLRTLDLRSSGPTNTKSTRHTRSPGASLDSKASRSVAPAWRASSSVISLTRTWRTSVASISIPPIR